MAIYDYEILPRDSSLGGGYRLRLLRDGEEVGGGIFPADAHADPDSGMAWFNGLPDDQERGRWLAQAGSARAVDAYAVHLKLGAHLDARETAEQWIATRPQN